MKKLSRLWDLDLMVEMSIDLITIYCSLVTIQSLGYIFFQDGWMTAWLWAVNLFDEDAHKMYVLGNLLVLLLVYWVPASLYTVVDIVRPQVLYQYKVQPERSQAVLTVETLTEVAGTVLSNQIVQSLVGSEVAWRLRYQYINMDTPLSSVPSLHRYGTIPLLWRSLVQLSQDDGGDPRVPHYLRDSVLPQSRSAPQ